jgi:hypothetical protein
MPITKLKAILIAMLTLAAAAFTTPQVNAAPITGGINLVDRAAASAAQDITTTIRYGRRGYGRRGYGRRGYYRPRVYRRAYYGRPVYRRRYAKPIYGYGRPVRCRIVYRQVYNGWGYVTQPVRVCRRW